MITEIAIEGLRGFSTRQTLKFALPSPGQVGLTVLLGANNSGKSTITEAIRALTVRSPPSFSQGKRNSTTDRVDIHLHLDTPEAVRLKTVEEGGSETYFAEGNTQRASRDIFILPSRRVFSLYFNKGGDTRDTYMSNLGSPTERASPLNHFTARLFSIGGNRHEFNKLLSEAAGEDLVWTIDQSDNGAYFLKVKSKGGGFHTSEGMGEGLVSLLYIVDAIYDSRPGQTIVIDEPELSLHPQVQRSLLQIFSRFAQDRQIIISTHSPYFVEMGLLSQGLRVARISADADGSRIHSLTSETSIRVSRLIGNANNPHIVGLNARESLFSGTPILLLEGQEDVLFLENATRAISRRLAATPFGWGVGGADNMETIASMLDELGTKKVVGLLDANKAQLLEGLKAKFPAYYFDTIPSDDIRSKPAQRARPEVFGLLGPDNKTIRPEYEMRFRQILDRANTYLT